VDPVSKATTEALGAMLPSYAGLRNPIDITGAALDNADWFERAAALLVADDGIDCVILNFPRHHGAERVTRDAQAIVELAQSTSKPIVAITVRTDHNQAAIDLLRRGGVPVFVDNEICAWVLARLAERAVRLDELTRDDGGAAAASLPEASFPVSATDDDIFSLLDDYGLPVAPYRLVAGREQAAAAAGELGFPVALKVLSSEFSHKTEAGGVRLGLRDADGVAAEWDALSETMGARWSGQAIVQAMSAPGLEVVVGLVRHTDVGPVVMVGAGGTLVEVVGDVAFAGLPLSGSDIERLIDSTALGKLVGGVRGGEALDRHALVGVIAAAGRMFENEPLMSELDLNPVILGSQGASIVDALVVTEKDLP
jgi:acetyltransferase